MASRRISRKPPVGLCSHWTEDDGIDPRFSPKRDRGKVPNRKALQLCRQVERVLTVGLQGELLRDLMVRSVVPGPDSSRLLVTLVFQGSETVDRADILAALQDARARLRAEIATAIHRRKTPELSFNVIRE